MRNTNKNQQIQLAIKARKLIQFNIDFCLDLKQVFEELKEVKDDDTVPAPNVYWMVYDIIENLMTFGDLVQDYMKLTDQLIIKKKTK